jgi:hypothetical protein
MTGVLSFVQTNWHIFTLIAILLGGHSLATQRFSRARTLVTELQLVWALSLVYSLVRGVIAGDAGIARENAELVMQLERGLGLFHEAWLQEQLTGNDWLAWFWNWVYVWWHWPMIAAVLIWLCLRHPEEYVVYRNAFIVSGLIGFTMFAVFPCAPPRFTPDLGVVDTVTDRAIFDNILLPPGLANLYAAMPSLHEGWNLLIGLALYRNARPVAIRAFGLMMPAIMFVSIVATGNHFILDGLVGLAVAQFGLVAATAWSTRARLAQPEGDVDLAGVPT